MLALTADVTEPADCERVVDAAVSQFGRLDVLVNNAGRGMKYVNENFITNPSPFWETDPAVWQMIVDTNGCAERIAPGSRSDGATVALAGVGRLE